MIVKNESHIIRKQLEKLLDKIPQIDYWVISDTGSTDETKDIIVQFFKEKNISGELFEDEWKDFGHNRTLALEHAFQKSEYLVVFDADDEIVGDFKLPIVMRDGLKTLEYDSYYFMFGSVIGISYNRVQLVTNKKKWRYIGVLHESIQCCEATTISTIKGNYYTVSGRSGARSKDPDKYLKDAIILEKAYAEAKEKNDALYKRYAFYCGNSYYDCGKSEEAIKWHKITLEQDSWSQEKYVCCMKIFDSYKNLKQVETGIYYLVKAFTYDKERVECLYELIVHYCLCGLDDLAYNYYLMVKNFYENEYLNKDTLGDKLFSSVEKYDFYLPYYMILVADKVKQYDTAIQMYRIVFTKKFLIGDKFFIGNILFNLQFFIHKVDPNDSHFFKLFKEYILFLVSIQFPVFDYDFMEKYEKYGIELPRPHVPVFSKEVCRQSNKILIYTGFSNIKWNYSYMKSNAIGGSESAVAYLANHLDKENEIYIVGDVEEEDYDNIHYVSIAHAKGLVQREAFKTIIVSRYVSFYQIFRNFSAYETYIWGHDIELYGYGTSMSAEQILNRFAKEITGCVCQTEWHKNLFASRYPALKDKIIIINNGINTNFFPQQNLKVKNRFMYSSCSERGLSTLLKLWPEIVTKLPDAQLFISSYNDFPKNEEERKMEKIIQENVNSIKHVGKLSQPELYVLMSTTEYWLYPSCFLETSCITSLEMLASNVICLYYPIAGLNDTVGDYGIKIQEGNEVSTLLLLLEDEERKESLKSRGNEYAMSCSWKNRAHRWNQLIFKPRKKLAIFNSFPFHYEMFGFILHYAEQNNFSLHIYTNTSNDFGWFDFYRAQFAEVNLLPCSSFDKRKGEYDFIFVTTDDDNGFQSSWITDRVVCINHFFRTRNLRYKNYFNIANFIGSTPDASALTCYPIGPQKKDCSVTILGLGLVGSTYVYDLQESVINRLRSTTDEKITLTFIGRNITDEYFKNVNKEMFHIKIMPSLETEKLIEELQRSSYVLINYVNSSDRHLGKSIAGCLPLALSALCLPILSTETNKQLQLKNCLEYEEDSLDPIYLNKLDFNDLNNLQKERQQNIDIFHSYMKQIERNTTISYIKIFADEGVTSWLEMYMEHELSLLSYENKVVLTKQDNYTHAIIINTCTPTLKSTIKRENVVGLSHEPYEILFHRGNKETFISYAQAHIGKYFIGDKRDLPSPFVEGQTFLVHNKPPPTVLKKKSKFCSFVVSKNKSLGGNRYRHELVKAIIETTELPIDIYGYSCEEYSNVYKGDARIKHALEWKPDIPFGTEPFEDYRFNICIENTASNHYFSEKIVNPLIYNTIPVYLGCKNIDDYLSKDTHCIKLKGNVQDDIEILVDLFKNQDYFASLSIDTEDILKRNNLFYNLDKLFDSIKKPNYKIYVVHYKKLTERKQHLLSQFSAVGVRNFEFISLDRDDLDLDLSLFEDNYSKTQIAISLSHMKAYKDIAMNNLAYGVILEDDVLLCPYFLSKLNNYMKQLPHDYDAVFLGEGCGIMEHRVQTERILPNQNVYLMEQFNKTKCTDSYVISLQCAKNIVEYLTKMEYKINEPVDWWLNKPLREIPGTDVYWCEPPLTKQGTITGMFQSSY